MLKPAPKLNDDGDRIKNIQGCMLVLFFLSAFTLVWVLGIETALKLQYYNLMDVRDDVYQTKVLVKQILRELAQTNQTMKNGA
jgi:hypothetical protein